MKKKFLRTTGIAVLSALVLCACGSGKTTSSVKSTSTAKEAGTQASSAKASSAKSQSTSNTSNSNSEPLNVMVPEWAVPSDSLLKEFTDSTGITVNINKVDWDAIRDKISIAASGGEASADVVEVDWSWVGEFGAADWLEPLEVDDALKADMPTISTFSLGDKVLALPYSNDYRIAYYNTKHFEKAGLL